MDAVTWVILCILTWIDILSRLLASIRAYIRLSVWFLQVRNYTQLSFWSGWLKYAGTPGQFGSTVRRRDSRRDSVATPGQMKGEASSPFICPGVALRIDR